MKKIKRIAIFLLAVVMILGSSLNVFADTTNGKITINAPADEEYLKEGEIYTAYKIFDVSYDKTIPTYHYTIDATDLDDDTTNDAVIGAVRSFKYTYAEGKSVDGFKLEADVDEDGDGVEFYTVTINTIEDADGKEVPIVSTEDERKAFAAAFAAHLKEILSVIEIPADSDSTVWADGKAYVAETLVENNITEQVGENQEEIVWSDLELGYWYVTTTTGSLCALTTTDSEVSITDKNNPPTVSKTVKEDATGVYGEENVAEIGDVVDFRTVIDVQVGAEGYVLYDKMETGLTLNEGSIKVYKIDDGADVNSALVEANKVEPSVTTGEGESAVTTTNYVVTIDSDPDTATENKDTEIIVKDADGNDVHCNFMIAFEDAFLASLGDNDLCVVYTATVNENAEVAGYKGEEVDGKVVANTNETVVKYGNNTFTAWDDTKTYSLKFDIIKTDENNKYLTGAEFTLNIKDQNGEYVILPLIKEANGEYHVALESEIKTKENEAANTTWETDIIEVGVAKIKGLDNDTVYWLKEVKAPAGYNMLDDLVEVDLVLEDGQATDAKKLTTIYTKTEGVYGTYDSSMGGVHIINQSGNILPSTGGTGTTIFYLVGGVLVIGAVVLLVTRKRMSNEA